MTTAHTLLRTASALVLAGSAVALGATAADAAPASAQDKNFVISNAQSNLAEISLGKLGLAKGQSAGVKELAQVTLNDHVKLQADLAKAAKAGGYTLPTSPNSMQLATAKILQAMPASSFDLPYSKAEALGHTVAIKVADTEKSAGADSTIKTYATSYVPIATMHYDMAEASITALAGTAPTAVSAGTGGQAQTDTASRTWELGVAAGLVVAAASGATYVARRRSA